jgi:hypothetical protein
LGISSSLFQVIFNLFPSFHGKITKFALRGLEVNHPFYRLSLPHLGIHLDIRQQRGVYEDVPRIESLCLTTSAEADHPNSFGVYHLQLLMDIEPCLYCLLNKYIYMYSIVHISNIIGWLYIFILEYIFPSCFYIFLDISQYFYIFVPSTKNERDKRGHSKTRGYQSWMMLNGVKFDTVWPV